MTSSDSFIIALVGGLDADLGGVVHQRARADAEHGAAARHVVELDHARRPA